MTKAAKRSIFICVFVVILAIVAVGGIYFYLNKNIREGYELEIADLEDSIDSLETRVFVAADNLSAGTLLTEECVVEETILTRKSRTKYVSESDFGKILLVDVESGDELTTNMFSEGLIDDAAREVEYDVIDITTNISVNDYVDVRLMYPDGTDYVVLSKKQIKGMNDTMLISDLWINEEEILLMDSAIIDAYIYSLSNKSNSNSAATRIYVTKYVLPTVQEASIVNYTPSVQSLDLLKENPNILQIASEYLSKELRAKKEESLAVFAATDVSKLIDEDGEYIGQDTKADIIGDNILNYTEPERKTEEPEADKKNRTMIGND